MLYTRGGKVWVHALGEDRAVSLGPGDFARWSPDGTKIAVSRGTQILVMNADGSERRILADNALRKDGSNLDFMGNGKEILYLGPGRRFHIVHLESKEIRTLDLPGTFTGEPVLSADGRWLAARDKHDLYLYDLHKGTRSKYAEGCSPGVSPDGSRMMNNMGDHQRLAIHSRSPKSTQQLRMPSGQDDSHWDNHHWSNHPDYLAAQGEKGPVGAYLVRISDNYVLRMDRSQRIQYPDLYIDQVPSGSKTEINEVPKSLQNSETLTVRVRLVERTDPGDPEDLKDYQHALAADLVETLEDAPGLPRGSKVLIIHWVIRDRKRLSPLAYKDKGNLLELRDFESLPEMQSKRLLQDLGELDTPRFWLKRIDTQQAPGPQP